MRDDEYLALKPGDKVGVLSMHGAAVRTVERRTATQVVLNDGARFNRRQRQVGLGDATLCTADEAIQRIAEIRAANERQRKLNVLRSFPWRTMTDEQLDQLIALLPVKQDVAP